MSSRALAAAAILVAAVALPIPATRADAQRTRIERTPEQWLADCRRDESGDDREQYCELRDTTVAAGHALHVDGRQNGSVTVHGWDRPQMRVVAKVRASAETEDEARSMARDIRVSVASDRIFAEGPSTGRHESWSVGYEIWLPRRTDLDLEAQNGGISVEDVSGRIGLSTVNGGLALRGVSGDVRGETTNGGLSVSLDGDRWQGEGLDLRTTNGGISLAIPERYNARLETGTVNGGMQIDFPITVQGAFGRRFSTTLGSGGAPIRVTTTNGGVTIRRE